MGRPKKEEKEKKIVISVTISQSVLEAVDRMVNLKPNMNRSLYVEEALRDRLGWTFVNLLDDEEED